MAAEELTVTGLTGVDVTLRVAGPGTRSYAFLIDWHIRLLLALALVLLGLLLKWTLRSGTASIMVQGGFVIAALVVYFFYHPVLEVVMRGRTPGKRMAGARLVTREGATPGTGALLMRNLFRLIDSLPACYVVGLVCCMVTGQRVRIGDLAAGTLLVLDTDPTRKALGRFDAMLRNGRLEPTAVALVQDLLERWGALEEERRVMLARTLLARLDARLDAVEVGALGESALRSQLQSLLVAEPQ